jgi:hypothetical protein
MSVSKEKATQNILKLSKEFSTGNFANDLRSIVSDIYYIENNLEETRSKGENALRRLVSIALHSCGQSSVVGRFLLNLDSGDRLPFNMTDLRRLDCDIHEDCLAVLKMDHSPQKKVHQYFENGVNLWVALENKCM